MRSQADCVSIAHVAISPLHEHSLGRLLAIVVGGQIIRITKSNFTHGCLYQSVQHKRIAGVHYAGLPNDICISVQALDCAITTSKTYA